MIYKDFKGLKLSALGFGSMRMPVINGDDSRIDVPGAEKMVDAAYKAGVNYFDTAWGYHMGNAETFIGDALKKYPRESFYLASKFPGYDLSNFGKVEEIFETQLKKCQVGYFDFYLIHNVCELNIDRYLDDDRYHTVTYLLEQVKNGRIRHLGFSAHGSASVMSRFLDRYGQHMEFGMIQMNYLDYHFQDAKEKMDLLKARNLPVWVMEPLRGGMLAKLSESNMAALEKFRPGISPVEWSFRFLQSLPCVTVILTGMTDYGQMLEKLRIFEKEAPVDGLETETLLAIAKNMVNAKTVPCTSCKYCLSHCPRHLNIPELLSYYNEETFTGGGFLASFAIQSLPADKRPASCIGCRSCEKVCPQQIKISDVMKALEDKTAQSRKLFFGK